MNRPPLKVGMQVYTKRVFPEEIAEEAGGHDAALLSEQMTENY